MKAVLLLCLLHAAYIETFDFSWPESEDPGFTEVVEEYGCESSRPVCGCCLMQREIRRFRTFFDHMLEEMYMELSSPQMTLSNHKKTKSSAFSLALNSNDNLQCIGPFGTPIVIPYDHAFINMGNHYSVDTHMFHVPFSGVYSLTVTLYGHHSSENSSPTCAQLQVNNQVVASLPKTNGSEDTEDSSTKVMALKLMAGDQVAVILPPGCIVCDDNRHMTVFTGFLLYATG